jgi:hypothetical protein
VATAQCEPVAKRFMDSLVKTISYKRLLRFQRSLEALPRRCITLRSKIDVNIPRHPASYFVLQIMKKREEMDLDSPHHSYQGNYTEIANTYKCSETPTKVHKK